MANSKKKFSNLFSSREYQKRRGYKRILIRKLWVCNVPGADYYVSKYGKVYHYLANPKGLPVVMHLNNNKRDCRVKNPKWGTDLENTLQAWFDGCFKKPNKIIYYNDVHHLYNQGLSPKEIANILPIHISSVKRILKGKGLIKYKDKFK